MTSNRRSQKARPAPRRSSSLQRMVRRLAFHAEEYERAKGEWYAHNGEIGGELRAMREAANVGLREAARRMKVSAPYVSDLEKGHRLWSSKLIENFVRAIAPNARISDESPRQKL